MTIKEYKKMTKTYKVAEVDCPACAAKMESKVAKIKGVESATLSFLSKKLTIEFACDDPESIMPEILKACRKVEPDCTLVEC